MRVLGAIIGLLIGGAASAAETTLASGLSVRLLETVTEETAVRLRYHAPQLADGLEYADVSDDMMHLCQSQGVATAADNGLSTVIVSLSAEPVAFGEIRPDIVQYFEPFVIEDSRCMWEPF